MQLHTFGNFDGQRTAGQPALTQGMQHLAGDILLTKLTVGHVDTHVQLRCILTPDSTLMQCLLQKPYPDIPYQAGLFQYRDKVDRRNVSPAG